MIQNTMQLYFEYGYYKVKYLFNYAIIGLLVSRLKDTHFKFQINFLIDNFVLIKICSIILVPFWKFLMVKFEHKYLTIIGNLVFKISFDSLLEIVNELFFLNYSMKN